MHRQKPKTSPKKLRREAKAKISRLLTYDEVHRLYRAAVEIGALVMATRIIDMRGGISVAEAEALVVLINTEAAANGSLARVVVEMKNRG